MLSVKKVFRVASFSMIAIAVGLVGAFDARAGIDDLVVEEQAQPFLGVMLGGHSKPGVRIANVTDGSGAEAAGLEAGDIILAVDGITIGRQGELRKAIRANEAGDRIDVTVLRDEVEQTFTAELGARRQLTLELDESYYVVGPNTRAKVRGQMHLDGDDELNEIYICQGDACRFASEPMWYRLDCLGKGCPQYQVDYWKRPMLGVQLVETTTELREHLGAGEAGVLVGKVLEGSPAEEAGLQVGDVIVSVDGEPIRKSGQIGKQLQAGRTIEIEVIRDKRSMMIDAWIPERSKR